MSNVPLPEPLGFYFPPRVYQDTPSTEMVGLFSDDQMHAHAAAVSAAKDAEIAQLRAARMAYASEFPLNADGEPDVGNIHANIRAMKERVRVLEDALRGMVIANERHSFLRVGDALTAARAALEKP